MKFKVFRRTVQVWDLLVFLHLVAMLFEGYRKFFDSLPYLVKASIWLGVVVFFMYSITSWVGVIRGSAITVLEREEMKKAGIIEDEEITDAEFQDIENSGCDFVTGSEDSDK